MDIQISEDEVDMDSLVSNSEEIGVVSDELARDIINKIRVLKSRINDVMREGFPAIESFNQISTPCRSQIEEIDKLVEKLLQLKIYIELS